MIVFQPKVDLWVGVLVAAVPIVAIGTVVAAMLSGEGEIVAWLSALGVLVLYAAVLWPLRYEVGPDDLVVRFGLFRTRVPWADVTHVRRTRNPLASPAMSLDRLQIDRRRGSFLLIAPADRAGFVAAVQERAPHVTLADNLR